MNGTFTVNGKEYPEKPIDYNFLCDMEDSGVSFDDIDKKPMKIGRLYLAYCGDMSERKAGNEIEAHVINGGDMSSLFEAMGNAADKSGFFQAIAGQATKTEEPASESKKRK